MPPMQWNGSLLNSMQKNKHINTATDKADTTQKGPAIEGTVADHLAEIAAHDQEEADIQTVQADTAHTASIDTDVAQHHIILIPSLPKFKNQTHHLTVTQKISQ